MVDHRAALITRFRRPRPVGPEQERRLAQLAAAPEPVRDAATVVLLRDAPAGRGIEAYLLKRTATMAFAGGMYVFPGGRVDPADSRDDIPWTGPGVEEVMHALDADPALARALVCAAVRETFEECGVLLAGPADAAAGEPGPDGEPGPAGAPPGEATGFPAAGGGTSAAIPGVDDPAWIAERRALESHEAHLGQLLTRRSLALRADLLRPWARWVTPELETRRYDTRFFVAALPAGQLPGQISGEADRMVWMRPAEALEQFTAGTMAMLPPTAFTLAELSAYDDVAAVLAAAHTRDLAPIMPKILVTGGESHLLLPHDDAYEQDPDGADPSA